MRIWLFSVNKYWCIIFEGVHIFGDTGFSETYIKIKISKIKLEETALKNIPNIDFS